LAGDSTDNLSKIAVIFCEGEVPRFKCVESLRAPRARNAAERAAGPIDSFLRKRKQIVVVAEKESS
jgi:hypothetical protein